MGWTGHTSSQGLGQACCPNVAFTSLLANPLPTLLFKALSGPIGNRSLPHQPELLGVRSTCGQWKLNSQCSMTVPRSERLWAHTLFSTRKAQQALLLRLHLSGNKMPVSLLTDISTSWGYHLPPQREGSCEKTNSSVPLHICSPENPSFFFLFVLYWWKNNETVWYLNFHDLVWLSQQWVLVPTWMWDRKGTSYYLDHSVLSLCYIFSHSMLEMFFQQGWRKLIQIILEVMLEIYI